MKSFLLDASVALAWFLDDPIPALAMGVRESLFRGDHAMVPALWILEVANGLAVGERRGYLTADQVSRSQGIIEQMLADVVALSSVQVPFRHILATARSLRLSAYDSVYLETARAEGLPLATLDRSLRTAAAQTGVGVVA